jgi:hypothetical protein
VVAKEANAPGAVAAEDIEAQGGGEGQEEEGEATDKKDAEGGEQGLVLPEGAKHAANDQGTRQGQGVNDGGSPVRTGEREHAMRLPRKREGANDEFKART